MSPPKAPKPLVSTTRTITDRADVDLVKYLTSLTPAQQVGYWELDLHMWGYADEADRPLAYLASHLDEEEDWDCQRLRDIGITGDSDIDDFDLRNPRDKSWRDTLATSVPWLNPAGPPSPEDLARTPGPHDVPLPGIEAATYATQDSAAWHVHPETTAGTLATGSTRVVLRGGA